MTGGAVGPICIGTTLWIAKILRYVRRRCLIAERIGLCPGSDSSHKCIDLFFSEHSTRALREGRHRSAWHSVGRCTADHGVVSNCEKNGIGQSNSCATLAVRSMTSCTVLSIEGTELHDFARWHYLRAGPRCAGGTAAGGADQERDRRKSSDNSSTAHCGRFSPFLSSIAPGTSIPARTAKGRYCQVRTRSCRETTMPATMPNPI